MGLTARAAYVGVAAVGEGASVRILVAAHLSGCCLLLSCHRAAVLPPGVVVSALVQVRVVNPLDLSAQDRHTL